MASNNPGQTALAQFSDSQFLQMILVELRLHTLILAGDTDLKEDLDVMRVELMNDVSIISADAG